MKKWCRSNPSLGLLLLRVAVGVVFIVHGLMKFSAMDGTIGFFQSLGLGAFWAYLVAATELVAGFAILIGFWTTWSAILLAIVMVMSIVLVKGKMGFVAAEVDIMLLVATLCLALSGPGKYVLGRRHACCGCEHDLDAEGVCDCCNCTSCKDGTCATCDCHK